MTRKTKTATLLSVSLFGLLLPCLAVAIVAPTGQSLEQVDTTFLGIEPEQASAPAEQGWAIQVGAFSKQAAAEARLERVADFAIGGVTHAARIVSRLAPESGRVLYRARFGGFDRQQAQAACASLIQAGQSCFAVADDSPVDDAKFLKEAAAEIAPATAPQKGVTVVAENKPAMSVLSAARQIDNAELSDMRGGFFDAAGAHFDFGASIRTMVNGQLALQTNVQWTPAGAVTQQLAGLGASIDAQVSASLAKAGLTTGAAEAASAAKVAASAATAASMPTTTATNAAPGSTPTVTPVTVGGLSGVQIPGATGGSTQVLANIGAGQIQNIVLNSASNQNIVQNTNVQLTIYNFPTWQQQITQNAISSQLARDVMAAAGLNGIH